MSDNLPLNETLENYNLEFDFSNTDQFSLQESASPLENDGSSAIRLTQASDGQRGSFFLKEPVLSGTPDSFSTKFKFYISNEPDEGSGDNSADGINFVLATQNDAIGQGGGSLGYEGIDPSVAVELDTHKNYNYNDIDDNHVGINKNGSVFSIASENLNFRLDQNGPHYAWVDYEGQTLEVRVSNNSTKPESAILSKELDLGSVLNIESNKVFAGFTAATGGGNSKHDILNWQFKTEESESARLTVGSFVPTVQESIDNDNDTSRIVPTDTYIKDTASGDEPPTWYLDSGLTKEDADKDSQYLLIEPTINSLARTSSDEELIQGEDPNVPDYGFFKFEGSSEAEIIAQGKRKNDNDSFQNNNTKFPLEEGANQVSLIIEAPKTEKYESVKLGKLKLLAALPENSEFARSYDYEPSDIEEKQPLGGLSDDDYDVIATETAQSYQFRDYKLNRIENLANQSFERLQAALESAAGASLSFSGPSAQIFASSPQASTALYFAANYTVEAFPDYTEGKPTRLRDAVNFIKAPEEGTQNKKVDIGGEIGTITVQNTGSTLNRKPPVFSINEQQSDFNVQEGDGDDESNTFEIVVERNGTDAYLRHADTITATIQGVDGEGTDFLKGDQDSVKFEFDAEASSTGDRTATAQIPIKGDEIDETDQEFQLVFNDPNIGKIDSDDQSRSFTVVDDDITRVWVEPRDRAFENPEDPLTRFGHFEIHLNQSPPEQLTVNYEVSGEAAKGFQDYKPLKKPIEIGTDSTQEVIVVEPIDDDQKDPGERITLSLQQPNSDPSYLIGDESGSNKEATLTIDDDETTKSRVWIESVDAKKQEGDLGEEATSFVFEVKRIENIDRPASVNYQVKPGLLFQPPETKDGFIVANNQDFGGSFPSGEVNFSSGQTTKQLTVKVEPDNQPESEPIETDSITTFPSKDYFNVELTNSGENSLIAEGDPRIRPSETFPSLAEGVIINDDGIDNSNDGSNNRSAQDGFIANGTVFFDVNQDGTLNNNEVSTITSSDGSFSFGFSNDQFQSLDSNGNGELDPNEGTLVLESGSETSDIATGLPFETPLKAPANAAVVTPLTTLVSELIQQGQNFTEAQNTIRTAFGINEDIQLTNFDPIAQANQGNPQAEAPFASGAKVQNVVTQLADFLNGATGQPVAELGNTVFSAIAQQLSNANFDLTTASTLESIINETVASAGISLSSEQSNVIGDVATIIAEGEQRISNLDTSDPQTFLQEVTKIQKVSQGNVAEALQGVGENPDTAETVVEENTGENLDQQIESAQTNNIAPPRVEDVTFAIDSDLEQGSAIGSIPASDIDGDSLEFSIVSGNPNTNAFAIDNEGTITVADAEELEGQEAFNLTVQASDGDLTSTANVEFAIEDNDEETAQADLNEDGIVNLNDLGIFATSFGSTPEESNFNPASDFNEDGIVNLDDLGIFAASFNQEGGLLA